jgi:hypothetical protein
MPGILTAIKCWVYDLFYGKDYFAVKCHGGKIICTTYQDRKLEVIKMHGLAITIDVDGKYDQMMADVWIKINGLK